MDILFLNPPILSSQEEREFRAKAALDILHRRMALSEVKEDNRWKAWVTMHQGMLNALTCENLMAFQAHPAIAPQITGGSGRHFLARISEDFGRETLAFLMKNHTETLCGDPRDLVSEQGTYMTITSMRHLYHLSHLHHLSRNCLGVPVHFLEIGGGFGNLARMVLQYNLARQYFIIDHPVLHAIQYFFLGEFFPAEEIGVLSEEGTYLSGSEASRIQLCSMFGYEKAREKITHPYVIASTMALTEIPLKGQLQYLEDFPSDYLYAFGQLNNVAVGPGGKSGASLQFSNEELLLTLGRVYHAIRFKFFGYHFEFLGRRLSAGAIESSHFITRGDS